MERLKEFEENLQANKTALLNIVASKIKNKSDASDILQRASITMWKKYDSFDKDTKFIAWASTIACYEAMNYIRSCCRCPVSFDSEVFDDASKFMKDSSAEESKIIIYEKLQKALPQLDSVSKRLLISVYVNGEEIKNLAEKDGKSPQTYYNKLTAAKKKLIELIK